MNNINSKSFFPFLAPDPSLQFHSSERGERKTSQSPVPHVHSVDGKLVRIFRITDSEKTLHIRSRSIFEVHLEALPSIGCAWVELGKMDNVRLISNIFAELHHRYSGPTITQIFQFQARSMGESVLQLAYRGQSNSDEGEPHFILHISVMD